jgi:pyridinium-3,5-biscarboxylic acid mononucleotide sulfurtransferase
MLGSWRTNGVALARQVANHLCHAIKLVGLSASAEAAAMSDLAAKRSALLANIATHRSCAVAYSGGVDSAVVAQGAFEALGDKAVAITGASASLAAGELEQAADIARHIGIRHQVIRTDEFEQPAYLRNAPDRCYHCKTELYTQLERMLPELGVTVILNGANADDAGDYRPGMAAAAEHAVHSPLAECGITKAEVRELAAFWNLPVWDKPASPCLSSRVAYGEEVTPERLAMVDAAEQFLRAKGLKVCRVRYHRGELARIEVPPEELLPLCEPIIRGELAAEFRRLGFKFVTIDLEGFRSGSLNQLLQIQ